MTAFAANSVLCRLALEGDYIDAMSFTTIRLVAGAVALCLILFIRGRSIKPGRPKWGSVGSLFVYMACFSFSYRILGAGTGALILFGAVQLTMIGVAIYSGERLSLLMVTGLVIAVGGLIYLLFPGVSVPDPIGAALMALSGVAWGLYSLWGRGATDPTAETGANFLYAVPLALVMSLLGFGLASVSALGLALAVVSGAVTSGMGYAIWYVALPELSATRAAIVQLSVPPIAAMGGVLFLSEPLSLRIIVATVMLISGISLVLWNRSIQSEL